MNFCWFFFFCYYYGDQEQGRVGFYLRRRFHDTHTYNIYIHIQQLTDKRSSQTKKKKSRTEEGTELRMSKSIYDGRRMRGRGKRVQRRPTVVQRGLDRKRFTVHEHRGEVAGELVGWRMVGRR